MRVLITRVPVKFFRMRRNICRFCWFWGWRGRPYRTLVNPLLVGDGARLIDRHGSSRKQLAKPTSTVENSGYARWNARWNEPRNSVDYDRGVEWASRSKGGIYDRAGSVARLSAGPRRFADIATRQMC